jgi:hypothetical protein
VLVLGICAIRRWVRRLMRDLPRLWYVLHIRRLLSIGGLWLLLRLILSRLLRRHLSWRGILVLWWRWPRWLLRMRSSHGRLFIRFWWDWRLLRLHTLIALRIEAWIYRRFRVSELFPSTLQWSMLGLLPCGHVWRWWNVHTGHRICV